MGDMTSKQRLLAAIGHEEPDRVPVAPYMSLWVSKHYGNSNWLQQLELQAEFGMDPFIEVSLRMPAYIRDPFSGDYLDLDDVSVDLSVENQGEVNVVRRLFHTPAGELSDEIVLAHPRGGYGLSPSPVNRECLVKGRDDVEKVRFLLPDPRKVSGANWRAMMNLIGERGLLRVSTAAGTAAPVMARAMGIENTMVAFYQDRETFDRLLAVFSEYHQALTKRILELGASIVSTDTWHDFGVSSGWSPKIWREAFKPLIKANAELVHSYGALYHYFDNGPVRLILPDLAEIGVDTISTLCPPPVGDVDLTEAKRMVGDEVCLVGNVDAIWVVQKGTPDQVREVVRETILAAARGGGFILGSSDSFVPETPRENVIAFFEAAREFGRYPLS